MLETKSRDDPKEISNILYFRKKYTTFPKAKRFLDTDASEFNVSFGQLFPYFPHVIICCLSYTICQLSQNTFIRGINTSISKKLDESISHRRF